MQRILPEPVVRMTQFYRAREGDVQFHGSCGQTALAVAIAAAQGSPADFEGVGELMIALTQAMIAQGIAAPNGASSLGALGQAAHDHGATVAIEQRYHEPLPDGWQAILLAEAGVRPIVLQVANGAALTDAETGRSDETGLRYHALAIVGLVDAALFLAIDGDHPEVTRRMQRYKLATLVAARPCGLLVLDMQRGTSIP